VYESAGGCMRVRGSMRGECGGVWDLRGLLEGAGGELLEGAGECVP